MPNQRKVTKFQIRSKEREGEKPFLVLISMLMVVDFRPGHPGFPQLSPTSSLHEVASSSRLAFTEQRKDKSHLGERDWSL